MSEPSSLYAEIIISKEARTLFLESEAAHPSKFNDWIPWLENQEMTGRITQKDILLINQGGFNTREYLDEWLGSPRSYGFEKYNEDTGHWTISMLEFSENYLEYIRFLSVLRNVHDFVDGNEKSIILVHSFLWGDTDSDILIEVSPSHKIFTKEIPEEILIKANSHFKERSKILIEQYQD